MRFVLFFRDANTLHREQGVLRTAVSFFADARLLAPKVAVEGIALRHLVIAVALREIHAAAVGEFAQQAEHLPLHVGGWTLGRIAEEDLVLDLQTAQLRVENIQFFVSGHKSLHAQCSEQSRAGARYPSVTEGNGTKVSGALAAGYQPRAVIGSASSARREGLWIS